MRACGVRALVMPRNLMESGSESDCDWFSQASERACRVCKRLLPSSSFGTRKFRGEIVPVQACFSCTEHTNKVVKAYRDTPEGHESHRSALNKYHGTDGYSNSVKRYEATEKHRAKGKRKNDKIMADPGRKLMKLMANRISDQMAGIRGRSLTLERMTGFSSPEDAMQHFQSTFDATMTTENYGKAWEIEHKIAKKWYNAADQEDVRRCWSKPNLCALSPKENNAKRIRIPEDDVLYQIGIENWPKSWNGVPPSVATKEAWYKHHHDVRMGRI